MLSLIAFGRHVQEEGWVENGKKIEALAQSIPEMYRNWVTRINDQEKDENYLQFWREERQRWEAGEQDERLTDQ